MPGRAMSRLGTKWICQHCTYENWPKALRCVICQNPRPTLIEEEASSEEIDIYKISPLVSPEPANPYQKWSCGRCTYLNWPRATKCTQCLQARAPSATVPPPSPPVSQEATTSTESDPHSSAADPRGKWSCPSCTYENWPKSHKCIMCSAARTKAESPGPIRTPDSDDQQNNCTIEFPSICTGGSNRLTETTEIEVQVSSEENQPNNYLSTLRRQAREADRLWMNACRAVAEGNPEPISRYLSSGGDPARQLTLTEAGLLSHTATFDPGFTLAHMAIRQERDEILALLLSNTGVTHPVAKRVPSDVGRDAAADIRRHITASFKQRKGPFSCYFVTEFVTFALPTEIKEFHPSVQKVLFDELLDQDVQKELEEDSAIINWSIELTETLGSRLYALWNRSAGNCLLDSALQATWGVFDRDNSLRQVLGDSLCEAANVLYPRWREAESLQARLLHFTLDEAQWQEDWASLVSLAAQPGSALEQMHVFTLAHVLRRPIIVYGVKYVKSFRGEALGYARFEGIYIPLLWEPSFCWKSPIALGYTRGHFSALVPMEPEPEVITGAGANPRGDLHVTFLPLMTADRQLLPLHFLTQGEVGREEEIIRQWLDCCVTEGGLLVAQQKVPRSPHLVLQMVDQWLEAYRKLSPHHRINDSQSGYSSDGDSDRE